MSAEPVASSPSPIASVVRVAHVFPSATNPRKRFDQAAHEELTQSVAKHGIVQPILVRPWPLSRKAPKGAPDVDIYELVAGERRVRAAKAAGLELVPALVRELTDAEALELAVIENLQRQDLHPLEEAEGYEQLQKLHGYTVEDLAAKVGKSRTYVYGRMKLTALVPAARKAFFDGALIPSTALLVARIPAALQEKAVKEIVSDQGAHHPGAEPMSYREAADYISREFMLRLHDAPFRKDDAELVPAAGPCTTCPKRTGNQRELFSDVQSADVCTDPTCFKTKVAEHYAQMLASHKAKGGEVLPEREAKALFPMEWSSTPAYGSGFVDLDERCAHDPKQRTYRALLGKSDQVVLARHPHTGAVHELLAKGPVSKALVEKGYDWAKKTPTRSSPASGSSAKRSNAQAAANTQVLVEARANLLTWAAVGSAAEKVGATPAVLRLLARCAIDRMDWGLPESLIVGRYGVKAPVSQAALEKLVAAMKPAQLVALLVEFSLAHEDGDGPERIRLGWACKELKVDQKPFAVEAKAQLDAEDRKARIPTSEKNKPRCRKCGCTEAFACQGGCSWVERPDPKTKLGLCSACVPAAKAGKKAKKR